MDGLPRKARKGRAALIGRVGTLNNVLRPVRARPSGKPWSCIVSGETAIASPQKAKNCDSDAIAASHVLKRSKIATSSREITFSCSENVENGDGIARDGHEDAKNGDRLARNGLFVS